MGGGGHPNPPEHFENPMINLYEKTEKFTLINTFRPAPHKKVAIYMYCPILSYSDT